MDKKFELILHFKDLQSLIAHHYGLVILYVLSFTFPSKRKRRLTFQNYAKWVYQTNKINRMRGQCLCMEEQSVNYNQMEHRHRFCTDISYFSFEIISPFHILELDSENLRIFWQLDNFQNNF